MISTLWFFKETEYLLQDTRLHNIYVTLGTLYITLDRYLYILCTSKFKVYKYIIESLDAYGSLVGLKVTLLCRYTYVAHQRMASIGEYNATESNNGK